MNATRELGDDESSSPINAAAAPPALKKAKKLAEKVPDNGQPKKPQLCESDALLICITECIMAKPDQWGVLLTSKYGKGRVQGEFIAFVTDETAGNEQFKGKSGLRSRSIIGLRKECSMLQTRQLAEPQLEEAKLMYPFLGSPQSGLIS